jgi:hypothetical protein
MGAGVPVCRARTSPPVSEPMCDSMSDAKCWSCTQVVSGHRPMYVSSPSSGAVDSDLVVAKALQEDLEDIFRHYKVAAASRMLPAHSL